MHGPSPHLKFGGDSPPRSPPLILLLLHSSSIELKSFRIPNRNALFTNTTHRYSSKDIASTELILLYSDRIRPSFQRYDDYRRISKTQISAPLIPITDDF